MQPIKQFTTTEFFKLFNEPTKLKAEENVALAPVQSTLLDMVKRNKITKQEIDKYSILYYYMSYEELCSSLDDVENEKEYEYADNNTIVIISALINKDIMQIEFEDLCSRMSNRNFNLFNEEWSDSSETSTICTFINNDTKASKNILKFIRMSKDEKKEDNKMDKEEEFYYEYYVTYRANNEDKALVIRTVYPIETSENVSNVIIQLAEKEGLDTSQIFLYAFSLMNIWNGIDEFDDESEEEEEESIETTVEEQPIDFSCIYVYSIRYKQNGEQKEYQSVVNVDINEDESIKLELAESLVRDQDSVSDDDEIEILEITKLADGGF